MENEIVKHGMKELVEKATDFLGRLVNPPLEELGGLLADHVKFWGFKNQVNLLAKAEKFLEEKGVSPQQIPLKTIVPLLDDSSLEEDASMQDRWASLLASAADPDFSSILLPSYVDLLKQLSPLEALMLDQMFDKYERTEQEKKASLMFSKERICELFKLPPDQFDLMASNLMRMNLLEPPASHGGVAIAKFPIVVRTYELVQLTPLARDFVRHARYGRD